MYEALLAMEAPPNLIAWASAEERDHHDAVGLLALNEDPAWAIWIYAGAGIPLRALVDAVLLEADEAFGERLARARPDLVFNVAEGRIGAESRESYVPAVCEALAVPYTGSGPLTLALALDKARTKEVLAWRGIATASWQVFASPDEPLAPALRFPLIVKLLHEGSSMGLEPASVVDDECALRAQVARLIAAYREPALVEEFIAGREFSLGLIGNFGAGAPRMMPMIEIVHTKPRSVVLFDPLPPVIDALIAPGRPHSEVVVYRDAARYTYEPVCPAPVDAGIERRLRDALGISIVYQQTISLRDFDATMRHLVIDPSQPAESRRFQLAHQLAALALADEIATVVEASPLRTAAARQLLHVGLANYAAGAVLMPYAPFRASARAVRPVCSGAR